MLDAVKFGIDTKWEMLAFVMILIFLLGFPFEWIEICLIVLPVFGPIMMRYDFSDHMVDKSALMTWFGGLVAVNLQTAFMTPPFGATLFYMKGTAPPDVTMTDVYRGMYPFVVPQVVGLALASTSRASSCGCHAWPASSTREREAPRRSSCLPQETTGLHPQPALLVHAALGALLEASETIHAKGKDGLLLTYNGGRALSR